MQKRESIKPKRLRILWNSNAPWASSGYSQQTADLLPLIRDEGYPIAASNFFGQAGGKFILDGIIQYPVINHVYGSDAMVLHGRDFKSDVCFTLQDIWVLNPQDLQNVNRFIPYFPVDHDPIPKGIVDKLKFAHRLVVYSKFAQKQVQNAGFSATYIPHTVNTEIFKPMDKVERKKAGGISPDTFVFGMVAANKDNPPRKSFQEVLDAFKEFLKEVPNSVLYIHTNPQFPGGFPIDVYAQFLGIADKVIFPDPYQMNFNTDKATMNLIYNTFDCLLAPSVSEGFCIPLIEAQAVGIPVITTDFTAMSELVEPRWGYKVKVLSKRWTQVGSYIGIPDTKDLLEKMKEVYKADRVKMGNAGRQNVLDNYDLHKVYKEKWSPFLSKVESEVYKD